MEEPKQDLSETVEKVDKDEKLLAVIKRHPFGIVKLYAVVLLGFVAAGGLLWMILPSMLPRDENEAAYGIIAILAVTLMGLMVFILFVATIIYFRSKLVVTDKTITQTIQNGLFSRKVSQLAVTNIEDVTALKNGLFPTIFNYGRLMIETAGEQVNFHFEYCPNADHYAKLILDARQAFVAQQDAYMQQNGRNYAAFQQQQYIAQNQMMNQQPYQNAAPQPPPPPMPYYQQQPQSQPPLPSNEHPQAVVQPSESSDQPPYNYPPQQPTA